MKIFDSVKFFLTIFFLLSCVPIFSSEEKIGTPPFKGEAYKDNSLKNFRTPPPPKNIPKKFKKLKLPENALNKLELKMCEVLEGSPHPKPDDHRKIHTKAEPINPPKRKTSMKDVKEGLRTVADVFKNQAASLSLKIPLAVIKKTEEERLENFKKSARGEGKYNENKNDNEKGFLLNSPRNPKSDRSHYSRI